jgi:hypothetical protein
MDKGGRKREESDIGVLNMMPRFPVLGRPDRDKSSSANLYKIEI